MAARVLAGTWRYVESPVWRLDAKCADIKVELDGTMPIKPSSHNIGVGHQGALLFTQKRRPFLFLGMTEQKRECLFRVRSVV